MQSADDVKTALATERKNSLRGFDRTFDIELAILATMSGKPAEQRLRDRLRSILSSAVKHVDINTCLVSLNSMTNGEAMKFLPAPAQAAVKFACKLATAVQTGTTHELKLQQVRRILLKFGHR